MVHHFIDSPLGLSSDIDDKFSNPKNNRNLQILGLMEIGVQVI
jgi:hypothetical protein